MKYYFSNKEGGFYPEDTLEYLESVEAVPDDLGEITTSEYESFVGAWPPGKMPKYDPESKKMTWDDAPADEAPEENAAPERAPERTKEEILADLDKLRAELEAITG